MGHHQSSSQSDEDRFRDRLQRKRDRQDSQDNDWKKEGRRGRSRGDRCQDSDDSATYKRDRSSRPRAHRSDESEDDGGEIIMYMIR